jgi:hypothetical protein
MPAGFYPFWFWNDRITESEVRWQIGQMAAQGIRGFYIHSRQGLALPYLSDAFFDMVKVAIDAASTHGMTVELYDEYPYPSGVAGGEAVIGDPQFRATALLQETHDISGAVRVALKPGRVLNCTAYPLTGDGKVDWSRPLDLLPGVGMQLTAESYEETGLTSYNRKRYFANVPLPVLEAKPPSSGGGGGGGRWRVFASVQATVEHHKYWDMHLDVLNAEAVRRFIDLTHERYRRRLGEHFGTRIRTIFTDETLAHWSTLIPELFRGRFGYDLIPLLPALQDASHPEHLRVAHDLHTLRYERFCETWDGPIRRWCDEHGLLYATEKASLRLSQLAYAGLPGCDAGHWKAGGEVDCFGSIIRTNARATASAAYFFQAASQASMCECYHSLGWSATLQDAKLIAEELLLAGVTVLVPHAFFYSTHSMRKHDAPPSFFFQMPYWKFWGALSRRVERIAEAFEGTRIDAAVLIIDPTPGLPTPAQRDAYAALQRGLLSEHIDFMMVDTDTLESGEISKGRLRLRGTVVSVVVLPPMRVVEPPLERWLARFVQQGGRVIDARAMSPDAAVAAITPLAPPSLALRAISGDASNVHIVTRRDGQRRTWLLANTGDTAVELAFENDALREPPLDDNLPPLLDSGRRRFEPFETLLLREDATAPNAVVLPRIKLKMPSEIAVRPLNPNLLRLGEWEMCLVDDTGREGPWAEVGTMPIANQLAMSKLPFAPAMSSTFGSPPVWRLPKLHARYRCRFMNAYAGPVRLLVEPHSLVGDWELRVNAGARTIREDDLEPADGFVRGQLGCDLTPLFAPGENTLTIALHTDRNDAGLLNPLYLAGDFGVDLEGHGPTLCAFRGRGVFEDYRANGLPHFAGVVEYEATIHLDKLPRHDEFLVELDLGGRCDEAMEVSFNAGPDHASLWSPRLIKMNRDELRPGNNALRIRLYTTLIRAFEGQRFDYAQHKHVPA